MPIHYGLHREEIESIWEEKKLTIKELLGEIKAFKLKEHSMFHKAKEGRNFWVRLGGNYCSINFNIENGQITYLQFGIDITDRETKEFIETILAFGIKKQFMILGSNFELFEPTLEKINVHNQT